jgi:hypothetical protein
VLSIKKQIYFENYPSWMVFFSNLVSLLIYVISTFIIYKVGLIFLILYLAIVLILEFKLIYGHCVDCYYYGKTCAFGKGKISSIFFKKGNPSKFCKKQITWKDIIPDFMISLVPAVIGIILLIKNFSLIILVLVIVLFILTFIGNGIIRSKLACKYCKQREIGCPAQKLIEKKK